MSMAVRGQMQEAFAKSKPAARDSPAARGPVLISRIVVTIYVSGFIMANGMTSGFTIISNHVFVKILIH